MTFFNGKNYFQGKGKDDFFNLMKDRLNNMDDKSVGVYFLKQLFNDELPIKFSKGKRDKILEFKHINRHQIIHGETTDFNTEINSLKALSLLATLAFNLKYLDGQNNILNNGEV